MHNGIFCCVRSGMSMKKYFSIVFVFLFTLNVSAQESDSIMLRKIYTEILLNGKAYEWLEHLSNKIGGRVSGSKEAEQAVEYVTGIMKQTGADTVWLQEVMVPHWVRGLHEVAKILKSNQAVKPLQITALGGSVATSAEGVTASVIEVRSFDELKKLGADKVKGKIVFYNHVFDQTKINTFEAYGEAVRYRWYGASEASRYGAVASIVRSMSSSLDDYPHTGAQGYNDSLQKIPTCAISTMGAEELSNTLKEDPKLTVYLKFNCSMQDSVKSYNVIGELRGKSKPEEILTIGGHLDAWETGKGANDDGAGVVQTLELMRSLKSLGIRPARTIRAVIFMNEENGLRGGRVYASEAIRKNEKHIAAIESDCGSFTPYGFGLEMPEEKKVIIRNWAPLFRPYLIWNFEIDESGADISPLINQAKVPGIGLIVDSQRYFDYHHAASDTFDKINKRELLLGAAAMASLSYLLSTYGL